MATVKELFEAAVVAGKKEFRRKADWTGICESVRANKIFLDEYPRIKENGKGSDIIVIDVNGTRVVLQGTSNLNDEERARYCAGGSGNGAGYTRTVAAAVPAVPFADWLAALKQFKAAGLDPQIIPNVPKTFQITLDEVMSLI